jgi:hypothetical protein
VNFEAGLRNKCRTWDGACTTIIVPHLLSSKCIHAGSSIGH